MPMGCEEYNLFVFFLQRDPYAKRLGGDSASSLVPVLSFLLRF